jgi:predicted nuclease of predicted toxin-antitoxin system
LITLDKDFGELVIAKGAAHAGIVRLVNVPAREQGPTTVQVLRSYAAELSQRAILTVYADRVRVRLAES